MALLAPSNLDYIATVLGLTRMGFTILFLSTRLSTEAYVNLLRLTNCQKIVVGASFTATAQEIQKQWPLSIYDVVTKDEYDLKQPSGPRFPYARPPNAAHQLSFVSPFHLTLADLRTDRL